MTLSTLLRATILALGLTGLSAAASANALDDIKAAKKIRVGIDLGAPFYGYIDDKMQAVGSDVEAARLLAQGRP